MPFSAYLVVCPLVLLAGFIDSIAGGGGLISLPAYLMIGLPPATASGTNKLSAALGTVASTVQYHIGGRIRYAAAIPAALTALPGSALGAKLMTLIDPSVARYMMIGILPVIGILVIGKKNSLEPNRRVSEGVLPAFCAIMGFVIGFYDGLVGPGTGTFLVLIMTMVFGMNAVDASGSAKVVNLASNVASLITYALSGKVIVSLGLTAAFFGVAGNLIGSSLTIRKGTGFIKTILIVVLSLLMIKMIADILTPAV